jgi:hypothetical protein
VLENKQVKLTKKGSVVAQTAGIMRTALPKLTPQEEHAAAEQGIAEEAIKRSMPR